MWVSTIDGAYVNMDQADRIETNDQGDGTFVLIVRLGSTSGVLQTTSVFTTKQEALSAAQSIVSGTTLTV